MRKRPLIYPDSIVQSSEAHETASALCRANRPDDALYYFRRALAIDPKNVPAACALIGLLLLRREFASAVSVLRQSLDQSPYDLRLMSETRRAGMALYAAGFWEDAETLLCSAFELEPWDQSLAKAYARVCRPDYLGDDVWDPKTGKTLRRYAAREGDSYIYVIDIAGTCNLRCPTCPVGNSAIGERPAGLMDYNLFEEIIRKIIRESPAKRPIINLYNWGEPLLHPGLPAMIALLRKEGLRSCLSSNLNIKRGLEAVMAANPDELKISLSGFTQETYGKTHTCGNLDLLRGNMRLVRDFATKHGATTHVWVGHHIYKSNQDQIPMVKRFCEELGFAYHPIPAFYMPLERLIDHLGGKTNSRDRGIMADLIHLPEEKQKAAAVRRSGAFDCELRFNQTVINHDGSVALCCTVYDRDNMLDVQFLDAGFDEIERRKYTHPFCAKCFEQHLEYAPLDLVARPAG